MNSAKDTKPGDSANDGVEVSVVNTNILEATLDKQESFFAKYLNGCVNPNVNRMQASELKEEFAIDTNSNIEGNDFNTKVNNSNNEVNHSKTPECNIISCGDDSNDTHYSGSTINEEINKSIALFEEDLDDIARVSNMRELLNHNEEKLKNDIEELNPEPETCVSPIVKPKPQHIDTINCSECGKTIPVNKFDEHADYHLALKLRDEERKEVREERERNTVKEVTVSKDRDARKKKSEEMNTKNETVTSITSFLTKIDASVPTKNCLECGKKVEVGKFSEHQDFHSAQKLSRELNSRSTYSNISTNSVKRKRKSASPSKKPKIHCKSIDLFFR